MLDVYIYLGKVSLGPLSGYLRLLGRRLYIKMGWRSRDTYFLGNLGDPLSVAVRLRRLAPRPVDVRRAAAVLARALAASLYVARRCRDSPGGGCAPGRRSRFCLTPPPPGPGRPPTDRLEGS